MKNCIVYLIGLLMLVTSCDRGFVLSGQVFDEYGKGIDSVKMVTSEKIIIYSDSLGHFEANLFGPGSLSDKLEILASKEGYETTYFDLSQLKDDHNISLTMSHSNQPFVTRYSESFVERFYFVNLIFINLMVLLTMIFITIRGGRYQWIWIFLILFLNITWRINYINGFVSVDVFQLPFYLKHYLYYPFTIKIAFPVAVVAYWVVFLFNKKRK